MANALLVGKEKNRWWYGWKGVTVERSADSPGRISWSPNIIRSHNLHWWLKIHIFITLKMAGTFLFLCFSAFVFWPALSNSTWSDSTTSVCFVITNHNNHTTKKDFYIPLRVSTRIIIDLARDKITFGVCFCIKQKRSKRYFQPTRQTVSPCCFRVHCALPISGTNLVFFF